MKCILFAVSCFVFATGCQTGEQPRRATVNTPVPALQSTPLLDPGGGGSCPCRLPQCIPYCRAS
jgi:hypothetical protein